MGTEIITTSEGLPDNMTTTEYPIEEISTEQPAMFNKEERSTLTEDPAETTTAGRDDISSTEVVGMNKIKSEIAKSAEKEEKKDYVFTTEAPSEDGATNKQSTEKPTNIEDETVEVSTLETETRDFSTEQAFADLPPPTAFKDEILKNESSTEQPSTSKAVDEQPETSTATPGETSTITDENSEEISITEVIPEETTTFDSMAREFPSKEEIFDQDSYDFEMKDDASSKLLDLVTQNFSEADNIIFDTEEIAPVNAPEDGIEDNKRVTITQHPGFLDRIQEERSRDQENKDGTTYRTEKSISKVVTQISV